MKRSSPIEASLIIFDFACSPEELTMLLGHSPSSVSRIGDRFAGSIDRRYDYNAWELKSDDKNGEDLSDIIRGLLSRFDLTELRKIPGNWGAQIRCYVILNAEREPTLGIDREVIELMAQFRCALDLDYFIE